MKILAIDAATEACSAALNIDGEIHYEFELAPRGHTQLILPMVDRLLKAAGLSVSELDALSYARGPGAFTGVRIAAGVIQGLSYVDNLPVIPVSTLAAIGHGIYRQYGHQQVLCAIDARMGEVYFGAYGYDLQAIRPLCEECVGTVDDLPSLTLVNAAAAGTGWSVYTEALRQKYSVDEAHIFAQALPSAQDIVAMAAYEWQQGNVLSAHQAQPVYLRDNVAKKKKNQ